MQIADSPPPLSWPAAVRAHAREHPLTASGLLVAGLAVAALFVASALRVATGDAGAAVRHALPGGTAGFAATALG